MSPALTSCMANGCGASGAGGRPASSCASRWRCSTRWGSRGSPPAPSASCSPPARVSGHVPSRPAMNSPPRKLRSPALPATDCRTRKSVPPVHQPAHRRLPPAQDLQQARHHLAQRARASAARQRQRRPRRLISPRRSTPDARRLRGNNYGQAWVVCATHACPPDHGLETMISLVTPRTPYRLATSS